jgi:serpin B
MKKLILPAVAILALFAFALWLQRPTTATAPDPGLPAPGAPVSDLQALASGQNAFALDLYQKLRTHEGNLFFSPYSLSSALAMALAGARHDTAAEMRKALRVTLLDEALHAAYADQTRMAGAPGKPYALSVANALWGREGFQFEGSYTTLLNKNYNAALTPLDFKDAQGSSDRINAWVAGRTNDKIKNIVSPAVFNVDSGLILTNAIYFKGNWLDEFEKSSTRDEPFYFSGGQESVPLMNRKGDYRYAEDPGLQALGMPYKGKELSMVILLPKEKDGLSALEAALTKEKLDAWVSALKEGEVIVTFPKFKLETDYGLADTLKSMGMPLAFTRCDKNDPKKPCADFSGILDPEKDQLSIGAVVHKAFVEVNEEGTEAAAATAVGYDVGPTSLPPPVPVFRADHPFLFLIRDDRSGAILFLGRLSKPSA